MRFTADEERREIERCRDGHPRRPLPIIPLTHALPVETGPLVDRVENYSPIGWSPSQPCKGAA